MVSTLSAHSISVICVGYDLALTKPLEFLIEQVSTALKVPFFYIFVRRLVYLDTIPQCQIHSVGS